MEKYTQDTQIALLQQSISGLTETLTRVELKIDKLDEASRNYLTYEHLEKIELNYIRKETFESLDNKVRALFWGLGIVFATLVGFISNTIFKFIGGK